MWRQSAPNERRGGMAQHSPLALQAAELQGEEPVIRLWVQDNQCCFCRGRAHTQRVALEKSLRKRECCDVSRLREKGSQQSYAEMDCRGIRGSCGSCSHPQEVPGEWRGPLPLSPLFILSSQLSALHRQHRAPRAPCLLASPPVQSLASLHTSDTLTIPKPLANKAGRAPDGNETFLCWRLTPGARLAP